MLRLVHLSIALAALLALALPAAACPLCDTGTGERVRAGTFGDDLGSNLLLTLLPFPVLAALVALVYFGMPTGTPDPDIRDSNSGA